MKTARMEINAGIGVAKFVGVLRIVDGVEIVVDCKEVLFIELFWK